MSDSEVKESTKKGGRGRPKKAAEPRSESKDSSDEPKAKRGRGRPPKGGIMKVTKGQKAPAAAAGGSKRGRGRPPKKNESKESKDQSEEGSDVSDKDED